MPDRLPPPEQTPEKKNWVGRTISAGVSFVRSCVSDCMTWVDTLGPPEEHLPLLFYKDKIIERFWQLVAYRQRTPQGRAAMAESQNRRALLAEILEQDYPQLVVRPEGKAHCIDFLECEIGFQQLID